MLVAPHATEFLKAGELFFSCSIDGLQVNTNARQCGQTAASKNVDGKVDGDGTRMKQIERPDIHCAAGQINPARGMRNDRSVVWQCYSVKNCAMWRNLP